ncbi:hypothetical protein CK507_15780 [Pseudomonas sp. WN033]|nr:hypothetical protein CK507_15780 [Pseudomonas sp. WN033]
MNIDDEKQQLKNQIDVLWEDRHKDMALIRALRAGQETFLQTLAAPALADVIRERIEQMEKHGHDPEHDAGHDQGELAQAAVCYALPPELLRWFEGNDVYLWPFERAAWKPTTRRRDLVKAAALILAEIERLDAMEKPHE